MSGIQTRVAPLGGPRGGLSLADMQAALARSNSAFGQVAAPVEDPRDTVQAMVDQYEPQPLEVPARNVPAEQALFEAAPIETMGDVAERSYSPYGARPVMSPIVNEDNQLEVDPETNQLKLRAIGPEDYNNQLLREKASQRQVSADMQQLAMSPYSSAKTATVGQLQGGAYSAFDSSAREQSKTLTGDDEIDRVADKSSTSLARAISYASNALFTADAPIRTRLEENGITADMPAGFVIAHEEGYTDPESQAPLALAFGAGLMKAAAQGNIEKGEKDDRKQMVSENGARIDDAMYLNDFINGVKHYAGNALDRMGIKMSPGNREKMAKAIVQTAIQDGSLPSFHYNNRVAVQVGKDFKHMAKNIERTLEVISGDYNRRRSATTPNRSGAAFSAGGQQLTRKSLRRGGIDTTAAEAVKDILGSIALFYDPKDVQYKEIEYNLIMQPEYLERDPRSGEIMYSRHWAAHRNGVSEVDYKNARLKVKPRKDYNHNNPEHVAQFEAQKDKQATEVINQKLAAMKYGIDNAKTSPGLRYSEWIHSLANQRFFPNSFDVDYMGDKPTTRDMIGFGKRDLVSSELLFDEDKVRALKQKANSILRMKGKDQHEALLKLNPMEGAAIGTMLNAVINYFSAVNGTNKEITKQAPADIVNQYTIDIGKSLAAVGKEYNDFLNDPKNASENIQQLLAGMEKGESMGSKNLWDDLFKLMSNHVNPVNRKIPIILSHHGFDDGNQNGIFLQSLFYGSPDNALRLGTFNPSLDDMREFAMNSMIPYLEKQLNDQPEKLDAWYSFFEKLKDKYGKAGMSKEFFKKPLMQTSYGMDASMFGEHLLDIIVDQFSEEAEETLGSTYGMNFPQAAEDLNQALTLTLREVVNSDHSNIMSSIGRYTAILNHTAMMEGISGDTMVFTPVEVVPVNKGIDSDQVFKMTLASGETILIKKKERQSDKFYTESGEEIDIESFTTDFNTAASKGLQFYYSQRTKKYSEFNNAIGTKQARNFAVLPIQSMDGDLVKMTTLFINKNRDIPAPALWVHDSIISSPFNMLLYRNAYNNISIPNAIPQIAKFGNKLEKLINDADASIQDVIEKGKPVGIGSQGDYPALGAFFDEQYNKIQDTNGYKEDVFLKRKGNDLVKWEKFKSNIKAMLDEAESYGWRPPGSIRDTDSMNGEYIRDHLAVSPMQFKKLADLSKQMLMLSGENNKLRKFVNDFAGRVTRTAKELMTAASENGNGIGQMTYGATGSRGDISKSIAKKPVLKSANTYYAKPGTKEYENQLTNSKGSLEELAKLGSGSQYKPSFKMKPSAPKPEFEPPRYGPNRDEEYWKNK